MCEGMEIENYMPCLRTSRGFRIAKHVDEVGKILLSSPCLTFPGACTVGLVE